MSEVELPEESDVQAERVGRILNDYFDRRSQGDGSDVEALIAAHPECADALREHFEAMGDLERLRGSSVTTDVAAVPGRGRVPADAIPGYELLEEISRGGMGIVYKARQEATGQIVAVKVLLASLFASDKAKRRFEHEVETLASLYHPAIVPVYDSGLSHGQYFYVMPFVDGLPVDTFVSAQRKGSTGRRWGQAETLKLFASICDAVTAAHQKGVIHRDLKPSNILVDAEGQPHILDFGLAKQIRPGGGPDPASMLSVAGQVVGTAAYMSPEQARGAHDETDVRSDVYALGVMLFQLLTGRHPYPVDGMLTDTLRIIQDVDPARPSSLSRGVNSELEAIVLKALAKEPERRYATAGAFASDVRRYLAGEPIDARRDSVFYVLKKAVVRHRRYAAMVLLVFAVVGVLLSWLEIQQWREAQTQSHVLLRDHVRQWNQSAAQWLARGVERELTNARGMVEREAARAELRQVFGDEAIDLAFVQAHLERVAENLSNSSIHSWALADARGIIHGRARYDPRTDTFVAPGKGVIRGNNYTYRDWFHGGSGRPEPLRATHISEPYVSTATGKYPMVGVSTPVWALGDDAHQGEPVGVLLGTLTLQHFADWLQEGPDDPAVDEASRQQLYVVLVNDRAQVVIHPDNPLQRTGDKPAEWADEPEVRAVLEHGATAYYDPITHMNYIVGHAAVPEHGWSVLVQQDAKRARAPLELIERRVLPFGWGAVVIAALVVLFLVIRSTLWLDRWRRRRAEGIA